MRSEEPKIQIMESKFFKKLCEVKSQKYTTMESKFFKSGFLKTRQILNSIVIIHRHIIRLIDAL